LQPGSLAASAVVYRRDADVADERAVQARSGAIVTGSAGAIVEIGSACIVRHLSISVVDRR
jgi:hypothetical protein